MGHESGMGTGPAAKSGQRPRRTDYSVVFCFRNRADCDSALSGRYFASAGRWTLATGICARRLVFVAALLGWNNIGQLRRIRAGCKVWNAHLHMEMGKALLSRRISACRDAVAEFVRRDYGFLRQIHHRHERPHPDYQRRDGLGAPKELPGHFADHCGTEYTFLYHRYGVGRKLGADPKPVWSLPHRLFAGDGAVDRPDGIVFQARRITGKKKS